MTTATLRVTFAGPLATYQDAGRPGHMRFGVAGSGPMDRLAHAAANVALGNPAGATAIEVSMGGLVVECLSGALSVAVTGGDFGIDHAGQRGTGWTALALGEGERLAIRAGAAGSWAYLAVAGMPEARHWLGHTATHSTSGFGGGALVQGAIIRVAGADLRPDRHGSIERPSFQPDSTEIRVVPGPQDRHFTPEALGLFTQSDFALTGAFDRMGVRLDGPPLGLAGALSIPSEPVARGSVQVAGDGVATVLLADHQTTGGYPKIATVISCDLDRLAQRRAGDRIRFVAVTPERAIQLARDHAAARDAWLARVAQPKGTLAQRLMRENLISGAVADGPPDQPSQVR